MPPPTLSNTTSEVEGAQSANNHILTHTGLPANTIVPHPRSREFLLQSSPPVPTSKRMCRPKPPPVLHSEDSSSDTDSSGPDGDGSLSGESMESDIQAPAKRPRISTITTQSSTRTTTLSTMEARMTVEDERTPPGSIAVTAPSESADLQPDTPVDLVRADDVAGVHAGSIPPIGMNSTNATIPPATIESAIVAESADGRIEHNPDMSPTADARPITAVAVFPISLSVIDPDKVPVFLRSHGTGNRRVDIFKYLDDVKDSHFQRVLLYYLNFKINDKSNSPGSLPTAKRPPEIAQWTSRARPASLPDYAKGK